MKILKQALIIFLICFSGEALHSITGIPIPGNVLGMLILFLLLCTGIVKLEMIKGISDFLLNNIAFFFIPAGVSLLACFDILKDNWLAFAAVCILTTIIIMIVTGHTVQLVKRGKSRCKL